MKTWFSQKPFRKVTHVIFDMDGLILDTEKIYEKVMEEIAHKYGKPFPLELRLKLLGVTYQDTAKIVVRDLKLPITEKEYLNIFFDISSPLLKKPELMKGAEHLLQHLHKNKIPLALATSDSIDLATMKTKFHKNLFDLFDHKVYGSSDPEVKNGKPAPDIFLVTASRFSVKPNPKRCLVFEDAPGGVEGAIAAGMQCVMVPEANCPEDQRKLATVVLNSLEEIKLEAFGLPPL